MITIYVKIMPAIMHIIDTDIESEMTFSSNKLIDILDKLSLKIGESFEKQVYDSSQKLCRKGIMIAINGRHLRYLVDDLDHQLDNGDTLGETLDEAYVEQLGASVNQTERNFNLEAGFTNVDDRLPKFFTEEKLASVDTTFDVLDEELDSVHI
jgi:hypothetical protein